MPHCSRRFPIAACHGCRPKRSEPDSLARLLPARGATSLFGPRLGVALENLHLLTDALGQIPQGELLGQALDQLASQVGGGGALRDLPDALGLDRARAMAFALTGVEGPTPEYWLALPIKECGSLQARLGKLMASRFDAHEEEGHTVYGATCAKRARWRRRCARRTRPWDRVRGVGPARRRPASGPLPITADESLARSPDYRRAERAGRRWISGVYLPAEARGGPSASRALERRSGRWSWVRLWKGRQLRARLSGAPIRCASSGGGVLVSGTAGQDLLGLLSPQAALRFQFGGDLSALAAGTDLRGALPGPLGVALDEAGIDPRDLLGEPAAGHRSSAWGWSGRASTPCPA